MTTLVTQSEIAHRLAMPRATVAAALNPRLASRLRPQVCQRVREAARQMGYVPNHAARRLARARSRSMATSFDQIGMVFFASPYPPGEGDVDPVCLATLQGAEHELSKLHASLTFVRVREGDDWQKVERLARAGGVDGWLLYGWVNDDVVGRLKPFKLPSVIVADHRCTRPVHAVTVDHAAAARLVVQHLAALGHRRIAFFSDGEWLPGEWFAYQKETRDGFISALKEFGLDQDERWIGHYSATGNEIVQWLRKTEPMPTAIFSPEHDWAGELARALKDAQLEVPKDLSIVSCELASRAARGQNFTRIELPMAEVGRQGALLLHKLVKEPGVKPNEVKIALTLIEGWSTALPVR